MFVLMICRPSLNMGHVQSKIRSLGEIDGHLVKTLETALFGFSSLNIFQNICLNDIQTEFEYGSYWINNQVTRSNCRKKSCKYSGCCIFNLKILKLHQNVRLDDMQAKFKYGSCTVKNKAKFKENIVEHSQRQHFFLMQLEILSECLS